MQEDRPESSDQDTLAEAHAAHLWDRRYKTIYRVRLSVLYHLKRERFFDSVDKWCSMLTAAAATTAVGVILKKSEDLDVWAAGVTAVLSLVPLVYNPADKARRHGQAAAEFRRLLADCERLGEHWSEKDCDSMLSRAIELEATEPAALSGVVIECQNQLALSSTEPDNRIELSPWESLWKHWWDFDASAIEARAARQASKPV